MRFTPHTPEDRAAMLAALGQGSVAELFEVIPERLRARAWDLPPGMSEPEVGQYLAKLAGLNAQDLVCFLGGGFYDHHIPAAVDALISRGEFYTAYTPYQAEMSQGTLQSIFEYQSAICRLTGLDAANASMYDGGTAIYEAAMMAVRKTKRKKLIVCTSVSPIYRIMLKSYTVNLHLELVEADLSDPSALQGLLDQDTAGLILQNPDFFGVLHDYAPHFEAVHAVKGLGILGCNPIALAVAKTPVEMGADIAVGEGQPLGLPLSFGGPYLGFMAAAEGLLRTMPGRIVGRAHDKEGRTGYCLTLQTREQHIRREKATSNICSNEALCALAAVIFLGLMGKQGLVELAELNMTQAAYARERLGAIPGVEAVDQGPWFNEFRVRLPIDARVAVSRMIDKGIAAGFPLGRYYPDQANNLLVAVTEKRSKEEIGYLAEGLEAVL
ncbi:MAG: aminomethyl-transferring glycine dehydrogenase subunit GcvPA [Proteobacteria bacterium]|nr:aminomethyl-transferring glycine dehydrogenase subunit GcvPA [Pseudomonadota bacterium]MBU1452760.1 aminomethyl-transferring glycine dehydrogenase subunit GcvPA [Pseudomonadota bacterium]MBU2469478.1 aminomethyl-transferring glycine dehydrogenase subunit GcvPA [Pseudomonadota bacterium]MBU2519424.1 aminomethyl-transferring glycine dehydrogenase subunit GcvPA [Pseudomonadota bacterium]